MDKYDRIVSQFSVSLFSYCISVSHFSVSLLSVSLSSVSLFPFPFYPDPSRNCENYQLHGFTVSENTTTLYDYFQIYLKRTCSLDTSAFSALEVLTTTALYKFTYLLILTLLLSAVVCTLSRM